MIKASLAAVTAVLVLGGCSSTVAGRGSGSVPPSLTPAPAAATATSGASGSTGDFEVPAASAWQRSVDDSTGIDFQLPGPAHRTDQPVNLPGGGSLDAAQYSVQIGGATTGGVVSVTIMGSQAAPISIDLDSYARNLAAQFRQSGVSDARVLELTHLNYEGRTALDFRFAFTSLTASRAQAIWLIRLISNHGEVVVAQTITFSVAAAVALVKVRAVQAHLVAEIRLP